MCVWSATFVSGQYHSAICAHIIFIIQESLFLCVFVSICDIRLNYIALYYMCERTFECCVCVCVLVCVFTVLVCLCVWM